MSILEKYTNAIDKKNESTMNELLHDDFKFTILVLVWLDFLDQYFLVQ